MIGPGIVPVRQLVFKINEEQRVRPLIKSSEQNLIMHMMHAMLVHMICFLSEELYKDLFANVLKILNFLRHMWNTHSNIIFGNFFTPKK